MRREFDPHVTEAFKVQVGMMIFFLGESLRIRSPACVIPHPGSFFTWASASALLIFARSPSQDEHFLCTNSFEV